MAEWEWMELRMGMGLDGSHGRYMKLILVSQNVNPLAFF